jgi:transglutaminase/protease-like cytokinesis protein 3
MRKMRLTKIIASSLVATSIFVLSPIGVSAEWKQNSSGWWYTQGNSYYTGWKLVDKNWYYFYSDGYMAHDTTIDGYYLNSNGAWTNSIPNTYGSNLDSLGQEILSNISTENPSFSVEYNGDMNDAGKAIENEIDNLKYTNPYEAYNISSYNMQLSSEVGSSNVEATINCNYRMTAAMAADLDTRVRSIIASIAPDTMSQSEKELAIHDWIVNNTQYDQSYTIYDPYNTLIKHTGVCEGYALLAQKMFTVAGIKSLVVEGIAGGEDHAWNLVYIDNKWHHVDVTWDDPVSSQNILSHEYYNLTDQEMAVDHSWDTSKYPSAN